jgi:hypothetical protein
VVRDEARDREQREGDKVMVLTKREEEEGEERRIMSRTRTGWLPPTGIILAGIRRQVIWDFGLNPGCREGKTTGRGQHRKSKKVH